MNKILCPEDQERFDALVEEHGEAIALYFEEVGCSLDDLEDQFLESYNGYYNSPEKFSEDLLLISGDLKGLPNLIRYNINWSNVWEDLSHDYFELDGHYFSHI